MSNILRTHVLNFDRKEAVAEISTGLKSYLRRAHKRGLVVAISGGIDSSVTAALCVHALGPKKVFALLLPEHDSSSESARLGAVLAEHLGVEFILQDIAPPLESIGCYEWRDAAIRLEFPDYGTGWKCKIAIAGGHQGSANYFNLIVEAPGGAVHQKRMGLKSYLQIVAATSYKQRIRKTVEYFHGDRLNYAVVGTPNRLEYDQGFFVKNGDGAADVKPIAHLYKSQVYALAEHLGLPLEIQAVQPTTDTYSMQQEQDEFYFSLPYAQMDVALWCFNQGRPCSDLALDLGISEERAEFIYRDIETKRKTTSSLHWRPVTLCPVKGPLLASEPQSSNSSS